MRVPSPAPSSVSGLARRVCGALLVAGALVALLGKAYSGGQSGDYESSGARVLGSGGPVKLRRYKPSAVAAGSAAAGSWRRAQDPCSFLYPGALRSESMDCFLEFFPAKLPFYQPAIGQRVLYPRRNPVGERAAARAHLRVLQGSGVGAHGVPAELVAVHRHSLRGAWARGIDRLNWTIGSGLDRRLDGCSIEPSIESIESSIYRSLKPHKHTPPPQPQSQLIIFNDNTTYPAAVRFLDRLAASGVKVHDNKRGWGPSACCTRSWRTSWRAT